MTGSVSGARSCAFAGLLLASLAGVRVARAASNLVIVLEPAVTNASAHRCLTRIREELLGGGFEVKVVDPGVKTDPLSIAEAIQHQPESAATIALLGDPSLGPSELWILDRTGARPEVRQIPVPADDEAHIPAILAIRTIELLRASALQRLVESNRIRPPPAPVRPAPELAVPVTEHLPRVAVELGLAIVDNIGGPGPAEIPVARLDVRLTGPLFVRLTLEGLGSRPSVQTSEGSATINQSLGLVALGAIFRRDHRLMPIVSLGAGALSVTGDGEGIYPFVGHQDSTWTAIVDGGFGLATALSKYLAVTVEIHALIAAPRPVLRFSGSDAGTIGRPAFAVAGTLLTWL